MKILFLTPVLPWPLVSGGQIRVYHLLKALQRNHQVTLVAYIRDVSEKQYLPQLTKLCDRVILVEREYKPWTMQALIRSFFSTQPLVMNIYKTKRPFLDDLGEYDAVYCECFYLMDKIPQGQVPLFLSEQNIEYLAYRRYVDALAGWKKLILWLPMKFDVLKMKYWEVRMWGIATKVAVMSSEDRKTVEEKTGRTDIVVLPNGVDTDNFFFSSTRPATQTILFVGNFNWFQNLQAVEWLTKEIFPGIKRKVNTANLLIVGKHVPGWLKKRQGEDIKIEESLDDIRIAYQKATVFLAPLRSGSGTKYKILEAMASGVPVVTTTVGSEGLMEEGMVVRETTNELAEAVVDVLGHPERYTEMTKRARKLIEENFDWKIIAQKLEDFLKK